MKTRNASLWPCFALVLCLGLGGCAVPSQPSVLLALDGPRLFIAADVDGKNIHGFMDRGVMAGVGRVLLYDQQNKITCQGDIDNPGSDKGRLYLTLACTDGQQMTLALRNLGPDQGMGVGRVEGTEKRITLFYHPAEDEARRRLRAVKADIAKGLQARAAKEAPPPAAPAPQLKQVTP